MSYNAKKILLELVEKYDSSVISKQGSSRNIKQRFNISKTSIPEYFKTSGFKFKEQLNVGLITFKEKGWVELDYDEDTDSIYTVILVQDKVNEINEYLNRKSRNEFEKELLDLFAKYLEMPLKSYVSDVISKIKNFESYQNLIMANTEDTKILLLTLEELLKLDHEEMERIFSVRVLKDSKKFQSIKSKIVHILKQYFGGEGEDEQVLADFNIIKNPGSVSLKGKGIISVNGNVIYLDKFGKEFIISASNIPNIEILELPVKRIITVENLTSFYSVELEDTLFVYLGGYHNHYRRQLLQLIYSIYPNIEYFHFGDIDAGGIYILEHLKQKTNIPFKPYMMNIDVLKKYSNQTISLTKNDIERLKKIKLTEFTDLVEYMLKHNQKLEQENIVEYEQL